MAAPSNAFHAMMFDSSVKGIDDALAAIRPVARRESVPSRRHHHQR